MAIAPMLLAPVVGYLAIVISPDYLPDELRQLGLGIFFLSAAGFGYFYPRFWWFFAILMMLPIEIESIFGIIRNAESHNLWPIELLFGFVIFFIGLAGTFFGKSMAKTRTQAMRPPNDSIR